MQFAISFWDPDYPWDEAMNLLKSQGVTAIETGPAFITEWEDQAILKSMETARKVGIEMYTCHGPLGAQFDLSALDDDHRRKVIDTHLVAIRQTALGGIKCVVIHPSIALDDPAEAPQRRDKLLASLEVLLPAAEKHGVTLALENMPPKYLCDSSEKILAVLSEFDSPALGVCLDIGHAHITKEGALHTLEALSERIVTFHLHDNNGSWDQHLHPPYGTIEWDPIIKVIGRMNFQHPITVEAPPARLELAYMILRDIHGLFEKGFLTVEIDGRRLRVICPKCRRYCYGTPEHWSCACD